MEAKCEDGVWIVKSDSGHTYRVTNTSCNCPQFLFRIKKSGGRCKHMDFIIRLEGKGNNYDEIISFIKKEGGASFEILEREFGSDVIIKLQALERKGEIIYNRRKDVYNILE